MAVDVVADQIDELVGALTDPIVVWPIGGWGETLPESIKGDIQMERLLQLIKKEYGVATWPEVCAYMYTVSLERPIGYEWTDIYMYAMTQYKGDKMPKDMRKDKLPPDQMRDLQHFREWLYDARRRRRLDQGRAGRRAERAETKKKELELEACAPKQVKFF